MATLSPTFIDYDRLIRSYVKLCTGLEYVIQGNTNAPSPTVPYASVLMISNFKRGTNWDTHTFNALNDNFDSEFFSQHMMQYRVQVYKAPDAQSILLQLVMYYDQPDAALFMQQNGLYFLSSGDIKRIDQVISSEYEVRASVDLNFMLISKLSTVIDKIASAEIDISTQSSIIINNDISIGG